MIIRNNINGFGNDNHCGLLIHCDETVTAGSFEDSSTNILECNLHGGVPPTQSIAQAKFRTNSYLFSRTMDTPNTNDMISISSSKSPLPWQYGSDDFTEDFWMYFLATPTGVGNVRINGVYDSASDYYGMYMDTNANVLYYTVKSTNSSQDITVNVPSFTSYLPNDTWNHLAVVRNDTTMSIYINGTRRGINTYSSAGISFPVIDKQYQVGNMGALGGLKQCYIDEYRISTGIVRWKTDFIAPNREY